MVSLHWNGEHLCGGAILNDHWILTAAHCAFNELTAYVGTNNVKSGGGVPYVVKEIFENPGYEGMPDYKNDIALLKVEKSIEFNNLVNPILLPSSKLKDNQKAVLTGWGNITPEGDSTDDLQYFNVTTLTSRTCQRDVPFILHDSQICAYGENYQGACNGDSGSPLVVSGTIVGVTSRLVETPCASGYPDIYTDVYLFFDWINKTIEHN